MITGRFVCALNRGRDGYQLPLALWEAGLLERFVTDYYAPDHPSRWLPGPLRRRHVAALPARLAANAPASFVVQSAAQLLRLPMAKPFALADQLLGRRAGRIATAHGAHLYCYHPHLPPEHLIAPGTTRIVFYYHPQPALSLELLRADHDRWPQVGWSFAAERVGLERPAMIDAWRRADAVICASAMTRRSLEHDGCPAERIRVIPYGIDLAAGAAAVPRAAAAEFLFVGQGLQRKGLHHLIAAWQACDPADARLTLVCYDIDPGIRAMIRSPSIRLLGRQSREALSALYAAADVFAMPSLVEGFGLVYGEALAHGCHLLGTANTGLPDLALPAEVATLVPAGDIGALAGALAHLSVAARAGRLDRAANRVAATRWQPRDFRAAIADHARGVLAA